MASPEDGNGAKPPEGKVALPAEGSAAVVTAVTKGGGGRIPPPPDPPDSGDDEEDGMLRMSFLEHLEELRSRILRSLAGVGVAFALSLTFCNDLWKIVSAPAVQALRSLGINPQLK